MVPHVATQLGTSPTDLVLGIAHLKLVVGLGITAVGFVGYRRNRSRPMLFLALGIAAITFLSTLAALLAQQLAASQGVSVVGPASELVELLGLVCIAYSLYLLKRG